MRNRLSTTPKNPYHYQIIHDLIHELESELSNLANTTRKGKVKEAVEYALDNLRHQVTEWVRTAEKRQDE